MITIFVLILMSSQIDCISICDTIKPNGVFTGLQIYRKCTKKLEDSRFVMNNRNGTEWLFDITFDGSSSLQVNESMATTDVIAVHRFGMCFKDDNAFGHRNCMTFAKNTSLEVKCEVEGWWEPSIEFLHLGSFDEYVFIIDFKKVWVAGMPDAYRLFSFLFFEKKTKTLDSLFNQFNNERFYCKNRTDGCLILMPQTIEEMDITLFNQIEGVVDFKSIDGRLMYLFLFRIDGRPKYCSSFVNESISDECKSSENLKTLFEECFPEETKRSVDPLVYVVIALSLLAVINTVGLVYAKMYYDYRRRQYADRSSVTSSAYSKIMNMKSSQTSN